MGWVIDEEHGGISHFVLGGVGFASTRENENFLQMLEIVFALTFLREIWKVR